VSNWLLYPIPGETVLLDDEEECIVIKTWPSGKRSRHTPHFVVVLRSKKDGKLYVNICPTRLKRVS
jgi:hypothetical protein